MEQFFNQIAKDNNISIEDVKYSFVNYVDFYEGIEYFKNNNLDNKLKL